MRGKYFVACRYHSFNTTFEDININHCFQSLEAAIKWAKEIYLPGEEAVGVYNEKFELIWGD